MLLGFIFFYFSLEYHHICPSPVILYGSDTIYFMKMSHVDSMAVSLAKGTLIPPSCFQAAPLWSTVCVQPAPRRARGCFTAGA